MAEGNIDVVAFPLLSPGHIIPFMRLCELLSSRNLNVVFVTTPLNAKRLRSEQPDGSRVKLLEIPMPAVPGLPEGVESTERVPDRLGDLFFRAMEETQPSLREILVRLRPSSIIVDFWPFYLPDLATELNIYTIFFPVIGAYSQCLMYSLIITLPLLHHNGDLPPVVNLPGLPKAISMRDCDLLPPFREAIKNPDSAKDIFTNGFRHFGQCSMVVVNTFYEMEAEMVDLLGRTFGKPVWSIGPLVPKTTTSSPSGLAGNPNSSFSDSECLKWLNSREPESVIYVNFGSQIALSVHQMQEVASGLEASGQSFLWAVKKPNGPEDMDEASYISSLPLDLQAFIQRYNIAGDHRSECRGLVVLGWVPQPQILGHPATGGHVSHCGWNSTLESIGQGVPMLAWPFRHDHPFEAKLLVEELRVAEEIEREENENGVFVVKREEVERAGRLIIRGEKGKEMRRRAVQLKEGAERATEVGGSSFQNLDRLALLIRSKSN